MLHAILYTHLMKGELGQAVDFIDSLIMQASVTMAMSGEELPIYDDGSRPPLMTLVSHRSQVSTLTFATLWVNSADDKLVIFFIFFPETGLCQVCLLGKPTMLSI